MKFYPAKHRGQIAVRSNRGVAGIDGTVSTAIGAALARQGITSNEILSQKRAEDVMAYIVSQGVNPDLISAQGFGDTNPVAPNDTAQGRAQNRRVELSLAGSNC